MNQRICKNCKYFQEKDNTSRAWDCCTVNPGKSYIIWATRIACPSFKEIE